MSQESFQNLLDRFRSKGTPELIDLMKRTPEATDGATLEAITQVLERRQARFPDTTKALTPVAKRTNMRQLNRSICNGYTSAAPVACSAALMCSTPAVTAGSASRSDGLYGQGPCRGPWSSPAANRSGQRGRRWFGGPQAWP